jgi:hypothetical protein
MSVNGACSSPSAKQSKCPDTIYTFATLVVELQFFINSVMFG